MIEEFNEFYRHLVPVSKLKPINSEEYHLFTKKTGLPVVIGSSRKHLEFIPLEKTYYSFFQDVDIFWMVPVDTPSGKVLGYVLRSKTGKVYRTVVGKGPQLMFGWHRFKDFKKGDIIVVTEGVKDSEYLSRFYPHVISALTSTPSIESIQLLATLTSRILIALDCDETGVRQSSLLQKKFSALGVSSRIIFPDLSKDWGGYSMCSSMDTFAQKALERGMKEW